MSIAVAGAFALDRGLYHVAYRALFYTVVSERVTRTATSADDVVRQLNEFVYLNVRTPEDAPVLDDTAADTLIRGFGYCDAAVFLFVRLLEEQGIPSRMTFLGDGQAESPHTIAEVYVDGGWRVFDTLYNFIPRLPDGQVASVADVMAQPSLLDASRASATWYTGAHAVVERGSSAGPKQMLQRLLHELVAGLPDWLADGLQDLYLDLPPPTYMLKPAVEGQAPQTVFDSFLTPDSRLYFRARNYHVFQRTDEAAAAYAQLLEAYPESRYADDARYELGLLELTQAGDPTESAVQFQALLTEYPATDWRDDATYLEARSYEAVGDCEPARALYQQVSQSDSNGLEDARARLQSSACP
jgi:hypothetical protein